MKLHVLSDIHAEFEQYKAADANSDVVVLAGDVAKGTKLICETVAQFGTRPVVYVAGNHEYYREAIPAYTDKLRESFSGSNIHFLENEEWVLGDVRFLGCTLWTDYELFGVNRLQQVMAVAADSMSDFRQIRMSPAYGRLRPQDMRRFHFRSRNFLETALARPFSGKTVVVTHHAPSLQSRRPTQDEDLVSASFYSDLSSLLRSREIHLWIHGHTHYCVDYMLAGTRILSNQRGYPGEDVGLFKKDLVIDV